MIVHHILRKTIITLCVVSGEDKSAVLQAMWEQSKHICTHHTVLANGS